MRDADCELKLEISVADVGKSLRAGYMKSKVCSFLLNMLTLRFMHLYNSADIVNAIDGTIKDGENGKCYVIQSLKKKH